jgi:hypothetical protein
VYDTGRIRYLPVAISLFSGTLALLSSPPTLHPIDCRPRIGLPHYK